MAPTKAVPFKPFVSAETLKVCALIGLHLLAADDGAGSSGGQSPDVGDMWRYGGTATLRHGLKSDGTSSLEKCEYNVESLALNGVEQDQSGEKNSLFLEGWELARVALSCHTALDMLCQEMHEAW